MVKTIKQFFAPEPLSADTVSTDINRQKALLLQARDRLEDTIREMLDNNERLRRGPNRAQLS